MRFAAACVPQPRLAARNRRDPALTEIERNGLRRPLVAQHVDQSAATSVEPAGPEQRAGVACARVAPRGSARFQQVQQARAVLVAQQLNAVFGLRLREQQPGLSQNLFGLLLGLAQSDAVPRSHAEQQSGGGRDHRDQSGRGRSALGPLDHAASCAGLTRGDRFVAQEPCKVVGQVLCRRVAIGRTLGHRLARDCFEFARNASKRRAHRRRFVLDDLTQDALSWPLERQSTGEQFVEHNTQRVDVAARVGQMAGAAGLFGRHVCGGAEYGGVGCERRVALQPHQAEVADVRLAALVDQDVRGLQVAVKHALGVSVVGRLGQFAHEVRRIGRGKRALLQEAGERLAEHARGHRIPPAHRLRPTPVPSTRTLPRPFRSAVASPNGSAAAPCRTTGRCAPARAEN